MLKSVRSQTWSGKTAAKGTKNAACRRRPIMPRETFLEGDWCKTAHSAVFCTLQRLSLTERDQSSPNFAR